MEEVKTVKYIPCTECIKHLANIDKAKRAFLKERDKLPRCRGCEKLKELYASQNRR